MSDSEQKPGFRVTDRRSFSDGEETQSAPAAEAASGEPPAPGKGPLPGDGTSPEAGSDRRLPPADFSTFILSLGSSALIHLGEVEPPGETGKRRDLPMAKHTIDLLTLLWEKTRSNLTPEEDKLLDSLLYDLRLRYVEAVKAGS
jgi:Domain of unknown function (DUF1844)